MQRHIVYLDSQYRGYYYLSRKIEEYLNDGDYSLGWNELIDDYQLYKDNQGNLSIKLKGRS